MVSDWRRPGREAKEKGRGRRELELAEGRFSSSPSSRTSEPRTHGGGDA